MKWSQAELSGREAAALLVVGSIALAVSGTLPHDRTTWWLETLPIFVAVPILLATARRPLHLRAGSTGLLGAGRIGPQPQSLRSRRPLRTGVCPGHRRARNSIAHLAAAAGRLAFRPGSRRVLGGQCLLRAVRMGGSVGLWSARRCVPRHARATCGIRNGICFWHCSTR